VPKEEKDRERKRDRERKKERGGGKKMENGREKCREKRYQTCAVEDFSTGDKR